MVKSWTTVLIVGLGIFSVLKGTLSIQFNVFNSGNVYKFSYPEVTSFTNDTELGSVACTEQGGAALNGSAEYYFTGSNQLPFKLNSTTGTLTLLDGESLDYEMVQSYVFNVSCSYISNASTSAIAAVEFSVQPVNEFLPVFGDNSVAVTISEAIPVGTVIASTSTSGIARYTVTDNDDGPDGELSFLPGSDNPPGFEINEITGDLTLTQSLDVDNLIEGAARIVLTIAVCDGNRPRAECVNQQISAIVIPVNDNPPVFEQDQYEITLSEATPVGTTIITVSCTDADRTTGEFQGISVEPVNGPVFIPDEKNGIVVLRQLLDFDDEPTVTFMLVCRDSGFPVRQDFATLVVTLLPVNDEAPQFNRTSYVFSINRITVLGQGIGEVIAIDLDKGGVGDDITYSLSGLGSENFIIRDDGSLVLNDFIFVVEGTFYDLIVVASDGIFNASAQVRINVDGVLTIPEIIIVGVSAVILFIAIVVVIIVCCCCCIGCYRCLPEQRKRSESAEEMVGMEHFDYPHPMPLPTMYDHGGPLYQIGQIPQHMGQDWQGSHDMLDSEEGENEPDMGTESNPSSSRVYTPGSTLKEMVDIFHEGDKVLDGKKKKTKDKK